MKHARSLSTRLPRFVSAGGLLLVALGCNKNNDDIAAISYVCATEPAPDPNASPRCGEGDPNLPPEPYVGDGRGWPPPDPDPSCILKATLVTPPDGKVLDEPVNYVVAQQVLDTVRINAALNSATCPMVKL